MKSEKTIGKIRGIRVFVDSLGHLSVDSIRFENFYSLVHVFHEKPNEWASLIEKIDEFYGEGNFSESGSSDSEFRLIEEIQSYFLDEFNYSHNTDVVKNFYRFYCRMFPIASQVFPEYEFYKDRFYGVSPTRIDINSEAFQARTYRDFITESFGVYRRPVAAIVSDLTLSDFNDFLELSSFVNVDELVEIMRSLAVPERLDFFGTRVSCFPNAFNVFKHCSKTVRRNLIEDFFELDEEEFPLTGFLLQERMQSIWKNDKFLESLDYKGIKSWNDVNKKLYYHLAKGQKTYKNPDLEKRLKNLNSDMIFTPLRTQEDFVRVGKELKVCTERDFSYYYNGVLGTLYCYAMVKNDSTQGIVSIRRQGKLYLVDEISGYDNAKIFEEIKVKINEEIRS